MKLKLQNLERIYKQFIMLFVDIITLLFALWLAFVLRLGEPFPFDYIYDSLWIFIALPIVTIPLFIKLGLYRSVLQYIGVKVIVTTFQATTISCLIIGFLMMFFRESNLPRSVLPIFWFIINIFIIITRFLFKGYLYSWNSFVNDRKQTIIYGAGSAGLQILENLKKSDIYEPIAFIDDNKSRQGTILNSLKVFSFDKIEQLIKTNEAKVLLFAMPSLSYIQRAVIIKKLSEFPIEVKVLPSIDNIVDGVVSIDSIKHVDVADILGRSPVVPKQRLLERNIKGKNILVTGASSGIGRACSILLSQLGANIFLVGRSKSRLAETYEMLLGDNHQIFEFDLLEVDKIKFFVKVFLNGKKLDFCGEKCNFEQFGQKLETLSYLHLGQID